ncbi:hypothetical protein SMQE30_15320 [Serratia marcescens]|nr:hypothetical protein SMQE30_15320 [Serratia marcescens]
MATTPTNKPVPSEDVRDLKFNSGKIDEFASSDELKYTDRKGVERYTIAGLSDKVSQMEPIKTYFTSTDDPDGTIAGIAGTPDGDAFRVAIKDSDDEVIIFKYYKNNNGVAEFINSEASGRAFDVLSERVDEVTDSVYQNNYDKTLHEFSDEDGFVAAKILMASSGVGLKTGAVQLMPEEIENMLLRFARKTEDGFVIESDEGYVLASFLNGVAKAFGVTLDYNWVNGDVSLFSKLLKMDSPGFSLTLKDGGGDIISLVDEEGFIFLRLTHDFELVTRISSSGVSSSKDVVNSRNISNLSAISSAIRTNFNLVQMPVADINVYIIYGQSFSFGTDSIVVLSSSNKFGNMMLGNSPRGTNYSSSTTTETFGPLGGVNALVDLVEVRQDEDGNLSATGNYGESPLSGWLNFSKLLHNQRLMVLNDNQRTFAGACCGVGGRSILQLSKGQTPSYYNHAITAMQGIKDAADAHGKTSRLCGILFMQMENDPSTPHDTYYQLHEQLYKDLTTDGAAIFGNELPPAWYNYQGGGTYASDTTELGASRALLDLCDNYPGKVFFVNPVGQLPNPMNGAVDNHLFANSYRWFGCDAAKVTNQIQSGAGRAVYRLRNATFKERSVLVDLSPPVPPITFKPAYAGNVATMHSDKGFTVRDAIGVLYGSDLDVEIVADTVIKITASRDLAAPVKIWLGDRTYHGGIHNIADSDSSLANEVWKVGIPGQPGAESISELNGKPYQLRNWCGSDVITATEEI